MNNIFSKSKIDGISRVYDCLGYSNYVIDVEYKAPEKHVYMEGDPEPTVDTLIYGCGHDLDKIIGTINKCGLDFRTNIITLHSFSGYLVVFSSMENLETFRNEWRKYIKSSRLVRIARFLKSIYNEVYEFTWFE